MLCSIVMAALAGSLAIETSARSLEEPVSSQKRSTPDTHVLHERHLPHVVRSWTKRDKIAADTTLPMRIGLKQSLASLEAGEARLMALHDKTSPHYGRHMTADETIDFFAPPQAAVDAVTGWIVAAGIARTRVGQSANRQWVQFDATADEVERLLFAEFYVWEHEHGFEDISAEAYHVPGHVQEHIDYITPGTRLRPVKRRAGVKRGETKGKGKGHFKTTMAGALAKQAGPYSITNTSCAKYLVADCLRNQYGIPNNTLAAAGNELGIFEDLDDHYSRHDLDVFFSTLYPHIPNGTYPIEKNIDGAIAAIQDSNASAWPLSETGTESSLDLDAAWPLIWPQKTVLFQTDDEYYESTSDFTGFWNTFLDALDGSYCTYSAFDQTGNCNTTDCRDPVYPDPHPGGWTGSLQCGVYKPTNVISVSYGGWGVPDNYVKRQCNELMKLGLQGVTVVVSSGDSGVGEDAFCAAGPDGPIFFTTMMSDCPYVLSVGSTELNAPTHSTDSPSQTLTEVATSRFASGGGLSNIHPTPKWQQKAVDAYFSRVQLPFASYNHTIVDGNYSAVTKGVFHRGGRAYPDLAAVGDRQVVRSGGAWFLLGGTSLSAPIVAAMVTLVNEARIASGKGPVGWFTDKLYEHPEVFADVTQGSNPGCGSPGFVSAEGWDPLTGWGSPIYPKFAALLEAL